MILGLAYFLVFQADPSTLHDAIETRLLSYTSGGWDGKDVRAFLAAVKVPPGSYTTARVPILYVSGTHIGPPQPWKKPGVKAHDWYTNNYGFTVYYGPDNRIVGTDRTGGIRAPKDWEKLLPKK